MKIGHHAIRIVPGPKPGGTSARDTSCTLREVRMGKAMAVLCVLGSAVVALPSLATTTVTTITYDAGDHVTSVTDPRGLATSYTYDGLGQLWQQASPDTGTTAYAYDSAGRRSAMTRADGTTTTYGYDSLDRVTSVSAGGQVQHFAYDSCPNGLGRLCTVSDGTGTTVYSYTPEGWVSGRGFTVGGTSYTLNYSYDAEGHVSAVLYPDANQASYSYTDGVVSGVTLTVNGATVPGASAITYRPGDQAMSGWTSSNGLTNTLTYDSDGRLTGIAVPGVESLSFGYDKANRIISRTDGIDADQSEAFDYDDQSRLTGVYGGSDTESYSYDADGNRLTQTINGTSASFTYGASSNRLTGISGAVTASYGYDAQGNTTTENGTATYGYDPFNRLNSAGSATDYVSPEGQRLRKQTSNGVTYFAPDANGVLLAEGDNGAWVDYVWLNGRLIGRIAGSEVDAVHDDQTGRPQVVTGTSGAVVWKATNYPFEREVALDTIGGLNLGFPGQYYDVERGLWNNGHRDYNASLGRYLESDPSGLNGGINGYTYVGGNPLSQVDPLGLQDADADSPAEESEVVREANYLGPNQVDQMTDYQRDLDRGECLSPEAERTSLYRAVMPNELNDILVNEGFRNPLGVEGKYFSTTPEGASSYAKQAYGAYGDGPFTTVETSIPAGQISPEMVPEHGVDGGISTVVVPTNMLPGLNVPYVLIYSAIPRVR